MSDDIYQRARADAALHDRLAAAYSGGAGFENALWWYAHPDADAPDGTPSPLRRIGELEVRMYSREAHPESATDDAAALTALRARVRADREAMGRAIAIAMAPPVTETAAGPAHLGPTVSSSSSAAAGPASASASADDDDADGSTQVLNEHAWGAARRPRWAVPVAAGLVGVLVGAGIALAVVLPANHPGGSSAANGGTTGGSADGGDPGINQFGGVIEGGGATDATAPGPTAVPWALDVLARPQQDSDVPALLYSTWLDIGTFRALSGPAPLYAARDESGKPCLVLVQDDGGYTADCVDASGFPDAGLTVSGVYRKADPVVSGAGSSADPSTVDATSSTDNDVYAEIDVVWLPSGELSITQKALVTAS
ncbi:MAG: hypothetical protein EPO52_04935 [Herbiconiux sp.]|uniref:hypothetical protein n=1 Tax=Herbiconiux sp. TaxID=1871186 RepID=UPI0011F475C6|nr:hypothetical protein [Herbiconiux sp.]TAJ49142.1 MAG: hypothetical protein EPO52_04935 [Herbiconiux sp.]